MRRLVQYVEKLCGVCWKDDNQETDATFSATMAVDGLERNLDLCTKHEGKITPHLLRQALLDYGTKVGAAVNYGDAKMGKVPGQLLCPVADCGYVTPVDAVRPRMNLAQHSRKHKTSN